MRQFGDLARWFEGRGGVLVALSGGVDSALVARAAFSRLGSSAVAVTADYRTLSREELDTARSVCMEIGIRQIMLEYDELENPDFARNDRSRCYHCRTELGGRLARLAERMGGSWCVVDGTHLDDLGDYRPGIEAMRQNRVRSPLVEVGFTKTDVRAAAREVGLSIHDKPSNACLASRIPWGERITAERLARVELGERIVRQMSGAKQVRVRDIGGSARIEVEPEMLRMFDDVCGDDVCGDDDGCGSAVGHPAAALSGSEGSCYTLRRNGTNGCSLLKDITKSLIMIGFSSVTLDPEGYRPGKLGGVIGRHIS